MSSVECSLCYRIMPMSEGREGLMQYYCRILKVTRICDECLDGIEKSKKEYFENRKRNVMNSEEK